MKAKSKILETGVYTSIDKNGMITVISPYDKQPAGIFMKFLKLLRK